MPKYLKELPPSSKGKYERGPHPSHVKIVEALHKKPGEWMVVREYQTPQAANRFARKIREGSYIAFSDGEYEAAQRGLQVFARFVG